MEETGGRTSRDRGQIQERLGQETRKEENRREKANITLCSFVCLDGLVSVCLSVCSCNKETLILLLQPVFPAN